VSEGIKVNDLAMQAVLIATMYQGIRIDDIKRAYYLEIEANPDGIIANSNDLGKNAELIMAHLIRDTSQPTCNLKEAVNIVAADMMNSLSKHGKTVEEVSSIHNFMEMYAPIIDKQKIEVSERKGSTLLNKLDANVRQLLDNIKDRLGLGNSKEREV